MSHWKKFESDVLRNPQKEILELALKDMGLGIDYTVRSIQNAWGNDTVDAAIINKNRCTSLGFKFIKEGKDTRLQLSGDFYGTGLNESGFINKLSQLYQKHHITQKLIEKRWDINSLIENENGEIEICASIFE